MRMTHGLIAALGSVLAAAAATSVGCGALPEDCRDRFRCPDSAVTGTGGTTTGTGGAGGAGPGGGDGGVMVSCIPAEAMGPVGTECGVFVSSSQGMDGADRGAKDKPWKTIAAAAAAAAAAKKPLYVCAETFTEAVTLSAGITVFGGVDCAKAWAYVGPGTKSVLTADPDQIPLTIASTAGGVALHDLAIHAVDAQSQAMGGGSSIAVVVDQAAASFVRCAIVAGNGMDGLPGETPTDDVGPSDPMDFAIVGNAGTKACISASTTPGGANKLNSFCMGANAPVGGLGGSGAINTGADGEATPANPQTAAGGKGQPAADPGWSCVQGQGSIGTNGAAGTPGEGANGPLTLGILSVGGYTGMDGKTAGDGAPGQGGGGGGGAKGKAAAPTCYGASGGGGGAGGCGGKAGTGGRFGGSSLGVVNLDALVTFTSVTIKVGKGGKGGDGGDGEFGGAGGAGGVGGAGNGTSGACPGGFGGSGGQGGKGGGARGGHAVGIAYTMGKPDITGVIFTGGTAGAGGLGQDLAHSGEAGVAANLQAF